MLLQPSYPATPLDTVLVGQAHLDVYATHTVVAFAPDGLTVPNTTAYFFTAIAFATAWKHNPIDLNYTLKIDELASLVDSAVPVPSWQPSAFEEPPRFRRGCACVMCHSLLGRLYRQTHVV
jgi:hypothetical protein